MERGERKMLAAAATVLAPGPPGTTAGASGCGETQPPEEKEGSWQQFQQWCTSQCGANPSGIMEKKSRYNKEMKKLKMEAPNRAGL